MTSENTSRFNLRGIAVAGLLGTMTLLTGCASVGSAFTPSSADMAQAAQPAWQEIKQKETISRSSSYNNRAQRVANNILAATGQNPSQWEVVVFQSDDLNAFALPGGKIGIYTGIMDLASTDGQLATIVGHEVAHVLQNHAGERYGQTAATQLGVGLAGAVLEGRGVQGSSGIQQALGLGAQVGVLLPFSRENELEADRLGLQFMAQAGYDPNEAVAFWRKMQNAKAGSGAPPEFLSTHPADDRRIAQLQGMVNEMGY
ncbi:M48 family metallopeptidase [Parvularcula flava]|uniref:M48 family metallopeptidase n=1 Tax=Aquisalinus luteolus TaxID=1566827 RepID=A0A8J3AA13_9PROT|nr:M48 family metallopeptidase [Aquisalinus luteolus]NHK29117.1 M48 family metallopeptidase [Aquisalinus luteolus]GGI00254.1 Zn-dependent protease [Aquisalinus luteolus]